MEIVTPAQGRLTLSATQNPELFALAKCGLGALGVVTKLKLQCVPTYHLAERTVVTTMADVRQHHAQWLKEFQHLRYMWIPGTHAVVVVQCQRITPEQAQAAAAGDAFPPPPFTADEQMQAPRELYLELTQGRHDPDYLSWSFTTLRDRLLELRPLDRDHVCTREPGGEAVLAAQSGIPSGALDRHHWLRLRRPAARARGGVPDRRHARH
ncbi:hypothetical protein PINS_up014296 [Pythium insidiosum]|nr:hypothetical protein PINS_up014296 [Pythium insidiosum]